VVTQGPYLEPTTHNPQSALLVPPPAPPGPARARASRGTRQPDDITVTADMVAWAQENHPDVDGRYETAKFVDYWRGKSGKDATKQDWPATWRNWIRKAGERSRPSNVIAIRRPSTTDQRVATALELAAKYAGEETS
jgi:hypothetical protein